jgi:transcriptional regulator with XRE-family HTH domain
LLFILVLYHTRTVCYCPGTKSVRRRAMSTEEEHPTSAIVARRLREIREDRRPRMTQRDLALRLLRVLGVPADDPKRVEAARVLISRTESGGRIPTVDDLVWLAQALEVPPGALLEGSGGVDALSDLQAQARDLLAKIEAASALQLEPLKEER